LSFDIQRSVERARKIIKLYEEEGISKERILVKIIATYEGIEAAKMYICTKRLFNIIKIFSYNFFMSN